MKTWQTKEEIHSEAWFGGQVERVVALLARAEAAERALHAAHATYAEVTQNERDAECQRSREYAIALQRVAEAMHSIAVGELVHPPEAYEAAPHHAAMVAQVEAAVTALKDDRDGWKASCVRARDTEMVLMGVGPLTDLAPIVAERDAALARIAELEASREVELMAVAKNVRVACRDVADSEREAIDAIDLTALVKGGGR